MVHPPPRIDRGAPFFRLAGLTHALNMISLDYY